MRPAWDDTQGERCVTSQTVTTIPSERRARACIYCGAYCHPSGIPRICPLVWHPKGVTKCHRGCSKTNMTLSRVPFSKSVAGVRRAGARAQEGRDAGPNNGENVSVAPNLSNDALANKATPFLCFLSCFWFCQKFFRRAPLLPPPPAGRPDGREKISDAKARKLCSPNKKNLAQTCRSLDYKKCDKIHWK